MRKYSAPVYINGSRKLFGSRPSRVRALDNHFTPGVLSLQVMPRVLLLLPTTTYRTRAFMDAALKLGVEVTAAAERPSTLEAKNPSGLLTLDFFDPELAARQAQDFARDHPVDAVIPVDEDTAVAAASVAQALRLEHNPVSSVRIAKNKYLMRECLKNNGLKVPRYWHYPLTTPLVR